MEYTAGPWRLKEAVHTDWDREWRLIYGVDGGCIAFVNRWHDAPGAADANAELIATAPDLAAKVAALELQNDAMRKVVEAAHEWYRCPEDEDFDRLDDLMQALDAHEIETSRPSQGCLKSRALPATWDGSPKGCWAQHPKTREICQLAPDGHTVHERDDTNGTQLLRWVSEKPKSDGWHCHVCNLITDRAGLPCPDCAEKRIDEAPPMKICGQKNPALRGGLSCVKGEGHQGNHEDCCHCWWR